MGLAIKSTAKCHHWPLSCLWPLWSCSSGISIMGTHTHLLCSLTSDDQYVVCAKWE